MNRFKYLALITLAVVFMAWSPEKAQAQIAVQIGPPPVCPYGYFDYPPYDCAPYGYYGPEWFPGGVFLGAGPWYRGDRHFWGHVDRHYDRRYGYHGEYPHRGERFDEHHRPDRYEHFRGNEMRDGHGHWRGEHGDRHERGERHEHGEHDHEHH